MPPKKRPKQTARKRSPTGKSKLLFEFKITLHEIKPLIWRRIQAPDCTLSVLHEVIQAAMGWENYHLHQFIVGGVRYGIPDPEGLEFGPKIKDESKVLLSQLVSKGSKGFRFRYEYDFGDGWLHDVVLEGSSPIGFGQSYPACLDGSRACPPEDCGGPWGYADFLEAVADRKHERHVELLEWIGGEFDPEAFDAKTATKAMMKAVRRSR